MTDLCVCGSIDWVAFNGRSASSASCYGPAYALGITCVVTWATSYLCHTP